jgi:CDP-diacylglycerol--serine O-phosphatidyltransferase
VSEERPRRFLRFKRRAPGEPRRKRRLPFDLKKALFILPNAFTVSSICCGLYAILKATEPDADSTAFYHAALAIFYAGFFDLFDGRVARLTKTQSDFGVQMDSLADVVSFGVAPSVLVYRWALSDIGPLGMACAFIFCACGAIRLARFNVLAARGEGSSTWFMGLPIPVAASTLVALVIAQYKSFGVPVQAKMSVVALTLVLSYLMVSSVRYYTFKTFRPTLRTAPLLALAGAVGLFVTYQFRFSVAVVGAIGAYIFYGLVAEVIFYRRRKNMLGEPVPSSVFENRSAH